MILLFTAYHLRDAEFNRTEVEGGSKLRRATLQCLKLSHRPIARRPGEVHVCGALCRIREELYESIINTEI